MQRFDESIINIFKGLPHHVMVRVRLAHSQHNTTMVSSGENHCNKERGYHDKKNDIGFRFLSSF